MNTARFPSEPAREFAGRLAVLARGDDRAPLAELRRFADQREPTVASWSALGRLGAPLDDPARTDDHALVAGLFAVYHQGTAPEAAGRGNLGASFGALVRSDISGAPAAERRLQELLALDRASLPDQLRRAVTLLRSKGVAIDWAALVCDLADWSFPSREVQESWMTAFVRSAYAA